MEIGIYITACIQSSSSCILMLKVQFCS